jgi:hypothetical protein
VFRLLAHMLALTPPPPLVDAICLVIRLALRQAELRPPTLAKVLCDLVARGVDYASPAVFAALRFVIRSDEFRNLVLVNPSKMVRMCEADASGRVFTGVYALHPFPKPDYPLEYECLFLTPSLSLHHSPCLYRSPSRSLPFD